MAYCNYANMVISFFILVMFLQGRGHGKLQYQDKQINASIIRTFTDDDGNKIDCIDIYKQPSLTHPLLKNHKIQLKPQNISQTTLMENSESFSFGVSLEKIGCPDGYIPVKRTSSEDLLIAKYLNYSTNSRFNDLQTFNYYDAMVEFKSKHHGVRGRINSWKVSNVDGDQLSSASILMRDGPPYEANSIMAGWIVKGDGKTRLFIYWNGNGPKSFNCFNHLCPGFVQVNSKIYIGGYLHPLSVYGGSQYEFGIQLHQDIETGNWWLTYGNTSVGYWPKSLFTHFQDGANYASWGGHVTSPSDKPSPPMGSGVKPMNKNSRKVAYIREMKVMNDGQFVDPDYGDIYVYGEDCYWIQYHEDGNGYWQHNVVFGGPGGCTGP